MESASQTRTTASLRALIEQLIDYAGLFPPAALSMEKAVENYASYLQGEHHWALGRFIVPVARLSELSVALEKCLISEPWKISAIVGTDAKADAASIRAFNEVMGARALIDAVEVKAANAEDVRRIRPLLPREVAVYFEVPVEATAEVFRAIGSFGSRTKIRTGGIVENAFPSAEKIVQFIVRCADEEVAFKATAGLHHPLRCVKPLTYAVDSPIGTMHGFLNVFLAACVQDQRDAMLSILTNETPSNIKFNDHEVAIRIDGGRAIKITTETIGRIRERFAIAFGSCSFEEPIEDLRSLKFL